MIVAQDGSVTFGGVAGEKLQIDGGPPERAWVKKVSLAGETLAEIGAWKKGHGRVLLVRPGSPGEVLLDEPVGRNEDGELERHLAFPSDGPHRWQVVAGDRALHDAQVPLFAERYDLAKKTWSPLAAPVPKAANLQPTAPRTMPAPRRALRFSSGSTDGNAEARAPISRCPTRDSTTAITVRRSCSGAVPQSRARSSRRRAARAASISSRCARRAGDRRPLTPAIAVRARIDRRHAREADGAPAAQFEWAEWRDVRAAVGGARQLRVVRRRRRRPCARRRARRDHALRVRRRRRVADGPRAERRGRRRGRRRRLRPRARRRRRARCRRCARSVAVRSAGGTAPSLRRAPRTTLTAGDHCARPRSASSSRPRTATSAARSSRSSRRSVRRARPRPIVCGPEITTKPPRRARRCRRDPRASRRRHRATARRCCARSRIRRSHR